MTNDLNHSQSKNQSKHSIDSWLRFLEWACPPGLYEGIEGDLLEQYEIDVLAIGERKAKRKFIWTLIKFLRPGIILRNRFSLSIINTSMIGNYFKVATRNMLKRKFYSFINHGMGKFPSVSVVDSAGSEVVGDVVHGDINTIIVNFSAPFQGCAFLN